MPDLFFVKFCLAQHRIILWQRAERQNLAFAPVFIEGIVL